MATKGNLPNVTGHIAASASATAVTNLTDNTGGTASGTLADVPTTYTEATLANQLASLAAKIADLNTAVNAIITVLEDYGLMKKN